MSVTGVAGGGVDELYMLIMEMQDEQRVVGREVRRAEQEEAVESLMGAADHMERAALWGALATAANGVGQIGSGAAKMDGDDGSASMHSGIGNVMSAPLQWQADVQKAEAKRCEAASQAHEQAAGDAGDVEDGAEQLRQTMLRRVDQLEETRAAAMTAALRA